MKKQIYRGLGLTLAQLKTLKEVRVEDNQLYKTEFTRTGLGIIRGGRGISLVPGEGSWINGEMLRQLHDAATCGSAFSISGFDHISHTPVAICRSTLTGAMFLLSRKGQPLADFELETVGAAVMAGRI